MTRKFNFAYAASFVIGVALALIMASAGGCSAMPATSAELHAVLQENASRVSDVAAREAAIIVAERTGAPGVATEELIKWGIATVLGVFGVGGAAGYSRLKGREEGWDDKTRESDGMPPKVR